VHRTLAMPKTRLVIAANHRLRTDARDDQSLESSSGHIRCMCGRAVVKVLVLVSSDETGKRKPGSRGGSTSDRHLFRQLTLEKCNTLVIVRR